MDFRSKVGVCCVSGVWGWVSSGHDHHRGYCHGPKGKDGRLLGLTKVRSTLRSVGTEGCTQWTDSVQICAVEAKKGTCWQRVEN